jgi:DUF971 family protein
MYSAGQGNRLTKPANIIIDREAGRLRLTWSDGHVSDYPLRWVRSHCPCATCREERRRAALDTDPLRLHSGPPPSTQVAGAELVGNYALRLRWSDGHDSGIFSFEALRRSCPCKECNPDGAPPFLPDYT